MRQLNGVYTQASNRRHGHSGHLFQGRYKAMVNRLEDWPWSSYPAMVGDAPKPK